MARNYKSIDRLVNFSDAVIAIAITLLVLPLVQSVSDLATKSPQEIIQDNALNLIVFVVSFLVISKFWLVHQGIFNPLKSFNGKIFQINTIWLMSIVIIPFTNELISAHKGADVFANAVYIGMLFLTTFVGLYMEYEVAKHPELWKEDGVAPSLADGLAATILMGLALIIAIVFPDIGLYSLIILIFSGVVTKSLRKMYK